MKVCKIFSTAEMNCVEIKNKVSFLSQLRFSSLNATFSLYLEVVVNMLRKQIPSKLLGLDEAESAWMEQDIGQPFCKC